MAVRKKDKSEQEKKVENLLTELEQGVKEVFTSGRYHEYLNAMAKFHDYSANNCLLIFRQCPTASLVAGFRKWQSEFNRHVKKGEKAIRILGRMEVAITIENEKGEEETRMIPKFFPCSVFDISQTEGDELPDYVDNLTDNIEGFTTLWECLKKAAPCPVEIGDCGDANGFIIAAKYLSFVFRKT